MVDEFVNGPNSKAPDLPGLRLFRQIGGGSFGEVWLGQEAEVNGAWRAIKVVRLEHFREERHYEREFRGHEKYFSLSRGQSGLVEMFHLERLEDRGLFYGVMELADSAGGSTDEFVPIHYVPQTLERKLIGGKALDHEECVNTAISLARALAHLHLNGLIHRDVKPSNIIFVNGRPKLADIGLVTDIQSTPSLAGTYGYIPYEGPGKATADVFALGKVIYEMMTGRDRFEFPELPQPNPALRPLNAVILKACADVPVDRYADGGELAADLERIRDGREPLAARADLSRWAWAAIILTLFAIWWLGRDSEEPTGWRAGMVAHWSMDGQAREKTGAVPAGNLIGKLQPAVDRFGKAGGATMFDGNSTVVFGDQLDMNQDDFSVSAWIKTEDSRFCIICKEGNIPGLLQWRLGAAYAQNYRRHMLIANMKAEARYAGHNVIADGVQSGFLDGRWHQVVAVFQRGNAMQLFQDGVMLSEHRLSSGPGPDLDSNGSLFLAAAPNELGKAGFDHHLTGALDDVRVWRRALSAQEIRRMYQDDIEGMPVEQKPWDFQYRITDVLSEQATRYLVETNNVKRFIEWQEPPIVYWGTIRNDEEGSLTYRFDFPRPVREAHLICSVRTWDFTNSKLGLGKGAGAIQVSTNGTDWINCFNGLEPVPLWDGDGRVDRQLDGKLMGGTNYFVRVRLLKKQAANEGYATAQHGRARRSDNTVVFAFKARFR